MEGQIHFIIPIQDFLIIQNISRMFYLWNLEAFGLLSSTSAPLSILQCSNAFNFPHNSFPDFQLDPSRSKEFSVNWSTTGERLSESYLEDEGTVRPYLNCVLFSLTHFLYMHEYDPFLYCRGMWCSVSVGILAPVSHDSVVGRQFCSPSSGLSEDNRRPTPP